jgi:hypothetical protein
MSAPTDAHAADRPNPYAAPRAELSRRTAEPARVELAEAEPIRLAHVGRETTIRSIAQLCLVGAFFAGLASLFAVLGTFGILPDASAPPDFPGRKAQFWGILALTYGAGFALNFGLGHGLYHLKPWARWTAVVFAGLGLLYWLFVGFVLSMFNVVPGISALLIGGGITGLILYILLSRMAAMVFSPQYKVIIAATPHIKYQTSTVLRVFVWICAAFFLVLIIGFILSRSS